MEPQYVKGPDGEMLKLRYENRPDTWTEKEILIAILSEMRQIRMNLNPTISKEDLLNVLNKHRDSGIQ